MALKNKVIVIFGATTTIGKATTLLLSEKSTKLILIDEKREELEKTANECLTNDIRQIELNIRNKEKTNEIISDIAKKNDIYAVINITEMIYRGSVFINSPMDMYKEIKEFNINPLEAITETVLPHIIKTKGHIINISNVISECNSDVPYNISKGAITHFTKSIASELAVRGVKIVALNPGPVRVIEVNNKSREKEDLGQVFEAHIEAECIAELIFAIISSGTRFGEELCVVDAGSPV